MNITHIEKDNVLNYLCSGELLPETHYSLNRIAFLKDTGLDTNAANSILAYFGRVGLVSGVNYRHNSPEFLVIVNMEAFDLYNHGGVSCAGGVNF